MYRKISKYIEDYLTHDYNKILCIDGARQVGKTYIIRELCKKYFKNFIELNMSNDKIGDKIFANVGTINEFYIQVSALAGEKMDTKENTIIFIDEIQEYPQLLTLLKPLNDDDKYRYICSGSSLGISLSNTTLIPMGSIVEKKMYPMDFEEFLLANSFGEIALNYLKECFINKKSPELSIHNKVLNLFKMYLIVGGMPEAIKIFVESKNIFRVKEAQQNIQNYYGADALKYDKEHKLKIKRIYDMVPSNIENKVKRIQYKKIENIDDVRYTKYIDEFDYLISSGIVLDTKAITEPKFPLIQSSSKNLIKLYMNDVGIFTNVLYQTNINAVLEDKGVNLGAVYETVVAQELICHNHKLYYYDRKKIGEVDYLIDDYNNLSVVPIEVKSGKDYMNFKALTKIIDEPNYRINYGYVLNNDSEIKQIDKIIYMPIYFIMFL
ncbi:MAG: AAA family ATPase [Bacilli bacterium]